MKSKFLFLHALTVPTALTSDEPDEPEPAQSATASPPKEKPKKPIVKAYKVRVF